MTRYVELSWNRKRDIEEHYVMRQCIGRRTNAIKKENCLLSWKEAEERATKEFREGKLSVKPKKQERPEPEPQFQAFGNIEFDGSYHDIVSGVD